MAGDANGTRMKFCKACNVETERYAHGACKTCAKARAFAWRAKNYERVIAREKAWRAANPDKTRAVHAAWRSANPGKIKLDGRAYRAANKERLRAKDAAYRAANPEKLRIKDALYRSANPESHLINEQNRRARKRDAGGKLSPGLAAKLFTLQRGKCACGCKQPLGDNYHLDHRMPLFLGGANEDWNIQLLRAKCNMHKHAKHPIDFMQSRGFLL